MGGNAFWDSKAGTPIFGIVMIVIVVIIVRLIVILTTPRITLIRIARIFAIMILINSIDDSNNDSASSTPSEICHRQLLCPEMVSMRSQSVAATSPTNWMAP